MRPLFYAIGMNCVLLSVFLATTVFAGGYSDYSSRKSAAQGSSARTMKYYGTYGQAGNNYVNTRDNWKVPGGSTGSSGRSSQMTPEQRAEYERSMQQADRLFKNAFKPNFGRSQPQASAAQKKETDRLINESNKLIQSIENDPLLK